MQIKQVEVSLSKEERRITDEYGNTASTWARIGFTADLLEGDDPTQAIRDLREIIQPQVDDWLLRQGGYIPSQAEQTDPIPELTESLADFLAETGGVISQAGDDDIPL